MVCKPQLTLRRINRSLYFTEVSAHKIPTELLKTASISFLSAIRNRLMVPTKFIESMIVLNELVLLFLKFFKVVFKAFPSLFIGLEEKLDEALAVASHVYGNSRSHVLVFELYAQLGMDVSSMRFLPYMSQEITKAINPSGTYNGGGSALVVKVYSLKLHGSASLHEQILRQVKLVIKAIEFTPIPKGLSQSIAVHPALQDSCTFQILASVLVEFLQTIKETESLKIMNPAQLLRRVKS